MAIDATSSEGFLVHLLSAGLQAILIERIPIVIVVVSAAISRIFSYCLQYKTEFSNRH